MIRSDAAKAVVSELFNTSRFDDLFTVANEVNKRLKEQKEIMGAFFKILNIESIKELIMKGKIVPFLDSLMQFLVNDEYFTKQEKKTFLNGCENILFLHALLNKKYHYADILNQFRIDKSLYVNREFLVKKIKEGNFEVVEKLINYSENVTYEFSKIIKLLYANGCRNYEFIKSIIDKHNFNINAVGDMGLEYQSEGTFAHLVFLTIGEGSDLFFNSFIKDFGQKINFNQKFKILNSGKEFDLVDIILSNSELTLVEKCSRLTLVLSYGVLLEKNISSLSEILTSEEFVNSFYDNYIFESLFSNVGFNSANFDRERVVNNILVLDNSEKFSNIRRKTGINPTSLLLDKFFRLSSPLKDKNKNPFYLWLKLNGENKNYNINTLDTLISHYRQEINTLNLQLLKIQPQIMEQLKNNGFVVVEQNFLSGLFKKERSIVLKINTEEVKPVNISEKFSMQSFNVQDNYDGLDSKLIARINDPDVLFYVKEISSNANQLEVLADKNSKEYDYIKKSIPKLVNKTLENFLVIKDDNIRKNTLVQLNVLNNNIFEMLKDLLSGSSNKDATPENVANKIIMGSIEQSVKPPEKIVENPKNKKNTNDLNRIIKIIK